MAFWEKLGEMADSVYNELFENKQQNNNDEVKKQTVNTDIIEQNTISMNNEKEQQEITVQGENRQQIENKCSEKQMLQQINKGKLDIHSMVFCPLAGIGAHKFSVKKDYFVCGDKEYSYSEISSINITNFPVSPLTNGVAQVIINNKVKIIGFTYDQKDKAKEAIDYASEQIAQVHGLQKSYKYVIKDVKGSKIEVYDDYLRLYQMNTGFKNVLSNSMGGSGEVSIIMQLCDVIGEIEQTANPNSNELKLILENKGDKYSFVLNSDYIGEAERAVEFIAQAKSQDKREMCTPNYGAWNCEVGESRTFILDGLTLEISKDMDIFNKYRLKFRALASDCANCFREEYIRKIIDYITFINFFPKIYDYYLNIVCEKAMETIISEGIWSINKDDFIAQCYNNFHLSYDEYNATLQSEKLTVQKNSQSISNAMGFVPHLSGGGFGLKGAAKGIAMASAFNIARDAVESGMTKATTTITPAQQQELFGRINSEALFELVFTDLWRTFLCLIDVLNSAKKGIWCPTNEDTKIANNIFNNMSSPCFPKDKVTEVMIEIFKTNPYNVEYYKFLVEHYGDSSEVIAIREYFGYTEFGNPRIV